MKQLQAVDVAAAPQAGVAQPAPVVAPQQVNLWPESLTKFLERNLTTYFDVRFYTLDPAKCAEPTPHGIAKPQVITGDPITADPLKGLIRIDEISAQRGFGEAGMAEAIDDYDNETGGTYGNRKLFSFA